MGASGGQAKKGGRRAEPTRAKLRERVKELDCIYGIAQVAARWDSTMERDARDVVELLPRAWQYPEAATAQVTIDGRDYATPGHAPGAAGLVAAILVDGKPRGAVEVRYARRKPAADEGPFLREERRLIDAVARLLGLLVERTDAAQERAGIEQRLLQADRLATIGVLAAGVAHELNEPLSSILGFGELLKRSKGLSKQDERDVSKVVSGALYARNVVRKLLVFARRAPTMKVETDINADVVEDVLSLFEDRCLTEGIELVRNLGKALPRIVADAAQLKQVVVNLVVNALQAMTGGGTLTVGTSAADGRVRITVQDTGVGMAKDVESRIFLPFFTTKGPGQGTGLGLAVVHGIVTAHDGAVRVRSRPGRGSRFEVELPEAGGGGRNGEGSGEERDVQAR